MLTIEQIAEAEDRFWSKVRFGDWQDCWLWGGSLMHKGYGQFAISHTRNSRAHRVAYTLLVGEIPGGLDLDHLCRVRHCVNPLHLEAVTRRENLLRGEGIPAVNARKTECDNGHPLDEENVYLYRGKRLCRPCRRENSRQWKARQREES